MFLNWGFAPVWLKYNNNKIYYFCLKVTYKFVVITCIVNITYSYNVSLLAHDLF